MKDRVVGKSRKRRHSETKASKCENALQLSDDDLLLDGLDDWNELPFPGSTCNDTKSYSKCLAVESHCYGTEETAEMKLSEEELISSYISGVKKKSKFSNRLALLEAIATKCSNSSASRSSFLGIPEFMLMLKSIVKSSSSRVRELGLCTLEKFSPKEKEKHLKVFITKLSEQSISVLEESSVWKSVSMAPQKNEHSAPSETASSNSSSPSSSPKVLKRIRLQK